MTTAELDAITALYEASTQGEWRVTTDLPNFSVLTTLKDGSVYRVAQSKNQHNDIHSQNTTLGIEKRGNAEFIVAAHREVPRLVEEVRGLREAIKPFAAAAQVYRDALTCFNVEGDTSADRLASEEEKFETAENAVYDYLFGIEMDLFFDADKAFQALGGKE